MITRAGPDPPAPAELAKAASSEGRRFGSAALLSKDLLFPKQLLLAGMSMGISWLVTPSLPAWLCLSLGLHLAAPPPPLSPAVL